MPTGGVSPTRESLTEWFYAGIACAGIGSKLIRKELVAAKDYPAIQKKVAEVVGFIREIRPKDSKIEVHWSSRLLHDGVSGQYWRITNK
jgi:hypothetical protein